MKCERAGQETHGEFYCTRPAGHEGPCAAVRSVSVPPERYPKPSLTADCVVLRVVGQAFEVLLIQRGKEPFQGSWALPGGFVNPGEEPIEAATRELDEETGISLSTEPVLVGVFGKPGRDPRGWVVSVAYAIDLTEVEVAVKAGDDASEARWLPLDAVLAGDIPLAFDHLRIVKKAIYENVNE